ncbi:MAG: hypothetical protein GY788_29400, partial [bacterium]|nr:hypothetical protein [bacterium]
PELGIRAFVHNNDFGLLSYNEQALTGVEGEIGWKLPIFTSDPDFEVRIFGGGFYYPNSNPGGEDIAGPRGRIEARIYDLNFLTDGSRLVLGGEVRNDDVRGTEGFGSVIVRVPLSIFGGGAPKLTGLDRRMVDRIEREMIITGIGYHVEDVFVNNGDAIVDTIFFSGDGAGGDGTYDDPANVGDAIQDAGENSVVIVDGDYGIYDTFGIYLYEGQSLIGATKPFLITGVYTGDTYVFTPKPAGSTPTISGLNSNNDLITFQNNATVAGLNLTGFFDDGITGEYINSNFWIQDNFIDMTGGFGTGIDVDVFNPRDNVNNLFTTATPSGVIDWNVVRDLGLYDGIEVQMTVNDGASHGFDFFATNNTVIDVDENGIEFESYTYGPGTSLKLSVDISGNS